jgi:hypothetical protein
MAVTADEKSVGLNDVTRSAYRRASARVGAGGLPFGVARGDAPCREHLP